MMRRIAASLFVIVVLSIAAWGQTPASQPAASQPTSAGAQVGPQLLAKMHHEEGWDVGTVRTFVLNDDRTFTWVRWQDKKPAGTLIGTLPKEKVQALMDHLAAAAAGVGAKDAGTATFEYVDSDKVNRRKQYTYPIGPPCSDLLTEIDLLARTHGKAPDATTQSQPATCPVDPNAVTDLIRLKIVAPLLGEKLMQGETKTVKITLNRREYFKQDVTLDIKASKGIMVEPTRVVVKASEKPEVMLRVMAAKDAALGEYKICLKGTPDAGEATSTNFTVKVVAP